MTTAPKQPHRVVIVGAGFGGLEAAFGLAGAPVQITVSAQRIPDCDYVEVPGLDHLPPLRDPEIVLSLIGKTVRR